MIPIKIKHQIYCWVTLVMITASHPANAETVKRPAEMNQSYNFDGVNMNGYGAEVNADMSNIDRLFTTDEDRKVPSANDAEQKSWLGIAIKLPDSLPKEPGTDHILQAIEVTRVLPDSGAKVAGLQEGDLIIGIDGKPVEDKRDKTMLGFQTAIYKKHPGEKVKLRILRGGSAIELEAAVKLYPRVVSVLKAQPKTKHSTDQPSLLAMALTKGGLTDEYAQLRKGLRVWSDQVVSPLVHKDDYNPFRLQEINYLMYNPLESPVVARKITDQLHGAFSRTQHDLSSLVQTGMNELDMTASKHENGKPPANLTEYLERLIKAIQHANAERAAVLSVLDKDEIDFLYSAEPRFLDNDTTSQDKEETETGIKEDEESLGRFYRLVLKLDLPRLLDASTEIARALDPDTLATLSGKSLKLDHLPRGWIVHKKKNITVIDTPAGKVLVGGTGDNVYDEDAALIIDLGGNDKYFNHAGGSTRTYPFSAVIDLSGDDLYTSGEDFSQGAGLLGGGFLIDLAGDDDYIAKRFSQGTGILGVGILADLAGNDQYTAVSVAQGSGSFGIGLLADSGGDDRYFGNYFVQGTGDTKGFGALVETAGDDKYFAGGLFEDFRAPGKSYQSMSQGFGFGARPAGTLVGASGGIGVLADAEGNDTYVADYFAQGSSYWFSLGILDDRSGQDRYIAGRYAQGAGIHMSSGVLIDGEGDDSYLADFGVAQGCGHDYGTGFLLDNGGNDRYIAGVIAQGAGNDNGIGVLSDNGGNDEYFLKSLGQGRGNFEPTRDVGSFGFLFDTGGGNDTYSQGGKNNSLAYRTQWGIQLDTR